MSSESVSIVTKATKGLNFMRDLKGSSPTLRIYIGALKIPKKNPQKKFIGKFDKKPIRLKEREHSQTKERFIREHSIPKLVIHSL